MGRLLLPQIVPLVCLHSTPLATFIQHLHGSEGDRDLNRLHSNLKARRPEEPTWNSEHNYT